MLYATMAATLRRRLQDVAEDAFADAVINEYLDVGISMLQAHIHAVNPAAFISTNTFATAAGTDLYAKQVSSLRIIRAEMAKDSGGYSNLPLRNFYDLVEVQEGAFGNDTAAISDLGDKWLMRPEPDVVKTVRVWYVPILTSSVYWDAFEAQIPTALQPLAIDFAYVEAMGEGVDDPGVGEARKRIAEKLALLPELYGRTAEQVAPLSMSPFSSSGR